MPRSSRRTASPGIEVVQTTPSDAERAPLAQSVYERPEGGLDRVGGHAARRVKPIGLGRGLDAARHGMLVLDQ